MPVIHKSTIRRARQAERRHDRNRANMNAVKTVVKKVQSALAEKKIEDAKTSLREAVAAIGKAVSKGALKRNTASRRVSKGALKRNTASRRVSRLTLRVNALSGSRS